MGLRIPTYNDAKNIVTKKGDLIFYEIKHIINGVNLSVFNYRFPLYTDFLDNEVDYREMRGLTFVFNKDGTYERYILLKKFWNINQVQESMYDLIKDYKILSSYNKEDGSLLSFIKIRNKITPKTKMGFDNDQTIGATVVYESNENIRKYVKYWLDNDIISMWEYVSFKNKIVLNYDTPNLILLRLRDNKTGEYIDIEKYRGLGFDVVEQDNITLSDAIESFPTVVDKEGTIFTLQSPNGNEVMVKKKTDWYFLRHNLLTNDINKENYIIKSILENTIDDIISQLEPSDTNKREFIESIESIVRDFLIEKIHEVEELLSKFDGDIKTFAVKYKKNVDFSIAISHINKNIDIETLVCDSLKYQTRKLELARNFIKQRTDECEN